MTVTRSRASIVHTGHRCTVLLVASTALLFSRELAAQADRPSSWGELRAGQYAVGFRQLLLHDPSRPTLAAEDGRATSERAGRQMQLFVWYPAKAATGTTLRYGDYIDLLAQELDFAPFTSTRRSEADQKYIAATSGLGSSADSLRRVLPQLRTLPVAARRDARPATGRFPLLLLPEWRTPATNHILAEYLASHGYVVASTTLKGSFDAQVEVSTRGIETQVADLRFVLASAATLPFVDATRVAAGGVGIAASGALALEMRRPLKALISLEGGITTELELGLLSGSPYYDPATVRAPMLVIWAPHPSVNPDRLNRFRYSERHVVHFPQMGEYWFLDYGMLDREYPRIIGKPPGDVRAGFQAGARWILAYLDAYVRESREGRDALGALVRGPSLGVYAAKLQQALPAPPSVADLKQIVLREGVDGLNRFVEGRIAIDSTPIANDHLATVSQWLSNTGRDQQGSSRFAIARLRVRLFPQSARAHFALGVSANQQGDTVVARTALTEALRLLPDDPDPALDQATRQRIRAQGLPILERLSGTNRPAS